MNYLLDTNVISELRKPAHLIDTAVRGWVAACAPETLFISVITVMELEMGVGRVERKDPVQGRRLRGWLIERVLTAFQDRMLAVDLVVARRAALLHVPDAGAERDTLIAATVMVHGMQIVTRNVGDFPMMGSEIVNPWS